MLAFLLAWKQHKQFNTKPFASGYEINVFANSEDSAQPARYLGNLVHSYSLFFCYNNVDPEIFVVNNDD